MVDLGFVGPSRPANDHEFVKIIDGDTPRVTMDVRMVSIDTPETKFEQLTPISAQAALERAKARLQDGTYDALPAPLRECDQLPRTRPTSKPLALAWDLGTAIGQTGITATVTFAAYMIGSFIEIDPLKLWEHIGYLVF
ncbi:hypothetical protein AB0C27_55555 [Nonomuraea sp. NPDC048882]|uniref:hypothetical protein n=1 Tax=Nonomuraea sp. NPDC048882 TaxID=3154347 RepID=UPI0033C05B35